MMSAQTIPVVPHAPAESFVDPDTAANYFGTTMQLYAQSRHGVDARCTGQVPRAAIRRQDSLAHGEGAVRNLVSELRIMGWIVGGKFRLCTIKFFESMVARDGVEPPTPAFSGLRSTT